MKEKVYYYKISFMLTEEQKKNILILARLAIESNFYPDVKERFNRVKSFVERYNIIAGVFVTLTKGGELRGCIGYIYPIKEFSSLVIDAALSSAFRDPRFDPLEKNELEEIEIEVSVLSEPRKIESISEIEVGKHGLIVRRGPFQGLLLPQVATEHNWDRVTFLKHTFVKAGLSPNDIDKTDVEVFVFEAEVFDEKSLGLV